MSDLVAVSHGLQVDADTLVDAQARIGALLSVCPPYTVVAGQAAAWLHGLWLPSAEPPQRIDVIVHPEILAPEIDVPAAAQSCVRDGARCYPMK